MVKGSEGFVSHDVFGESLSSDEKMLRRAG